MTHLIEYFMAQVDYIKNGLSVKWIC